MSYPVDAHKALAEIEDNSFWFRHRAAVLATVLQPRFPPTGRVFDVGGGNGYMVRGLKGTWHRGNPRRARGRWSQSRSGSWPRAGGQRDIDDRWIPE